MRRFRKTVYGHYRAHGRDLPWRKTRDPYHVLVSEVMLQQTQVPRVVEKYPALIGRFPTVTSLAKAPVRAVLAAWQGLGYNRRALSLRKAAGIVCREYGGRVPSDEDSLVRLPGIGKATAGSIRAFAFNEPAVFIETNIRSVFIHHFFKGRNDVRDEELMPLVERALDRRKPRVWYNALMDYGVHLKGANKNPSRRSRHYKRQSPFKGSRREVRGMILRTLLERKRVDEKELRGMIGADRRGAALSDIVGHLCRDGLIRKKGRFLSI